MAGADNQGKWHKYQFKEAVGLVKRYENGEIYFGGIVAHNTSGILLRAGASSLQLSSGATSTTADIQLAAADKISLFSSSFSLTTSSMTDGDIKLDSAGTLTISTSRNNTNIALLPNISGVALGISTPNASATLDLSSTTKGLLPPRMTTTQRDAISSPPKGLIVMNDSTNQLNIYNGSSWVPVGALRRRFVQRKFRLYCCPNPRISQYHHFGRRHQQHRHRHFGFDHFRFQLLLQLLRVCLRTGQFAGLRCLRQLAIAQRLGRLGRCRQRHFGRFIDRGFRQRQQ